MLTVDVDILFFIEGVFNAILQFQYHGTRSIDQLNIGQLKDKRIAGLKLLMEAKGLKIDDLDNYRNILIKGPLSDLPDRDNVRNYIKEKWGSLSIEKDKNDKVIE